MQCGAPLLNFKDKIFIVNDLCEKLFPNVYLKGHIIKESGMDIDYVHVVV